MYTRPDWRSTQNQNGVHRVQIEETGSEWSTQGQMLQTTNPESPCNVFKKLFMYSISLIYDVIYLMTIFSQIGETQQYEHGNMYKTGGGGGIEHRITA